MKFLHTHLTPAGAALALLAAMSISTAVEAQQPRFRFTPIAKVKYTVEDPLDPLVIGFTPNVETYGAIGLNNKNQVVYGYPYNEEEPDDITAFIWLPVVDSAYGSFAGFWELRDLSSSDATDPSIAREINEAGFIAGQSNGIGISAGDATFWNMGSGAANNTAGLARISSAHGVNDDSPPKLSGWRRVSGTSCNFRGPDNAFRWVLNGGSGTVTDLDPIIDYEDENSVGYDIGLDDTVAGLSAACEQPGCMGDSLGTAWETTTAIELPLGSIGSGSLARSNHSYGVDDDGRLVGWTHHQPSLQIGCRDDATFWENPSDTGPINLGNTMPSGQSGDWSRAFAINNLANPQVVGTNDSDDIAVLWERISDTWYVTDLNTQIPCCWQDFIIREAHDINDNGWITAWAVWENPHTEHVETWVVLLSPGCHEDIDLDGDIDVNDLNMVYFSNGSCPGPGGMASGDVDNDCDIDENDFAQIVAAYGECGEGGEGGEGLGAGGQELALTWLAAGGGEGLESETIVMQDVADALEESTVPERIASLFELIAD